MLRNRIIITLVEYWWKVKVIKDRWIRNLICNFIVQNFVYKIEGEQWFLSGL